MKNKKVISVIADKIAEKTVKKLTKIKCEHELARCHAMIFDKIMLDASKATDAQLGVFSSFTKDDIDDFADGFIKVWEERLKTKL